jgi:hypothetical protein
MGGGGKTSTTTQSSTAVQELNLQDTGGITVAENKGATSLVYAPVTNTTDAGAVASASRLARAALSGNAAATAGAFSLASTVSSDVSHEAIVLGQSAIDAGTGIANHGLDNAAAAYQSGLTFGSDALNTVAQIAADSLGHQEALTSNALQGFATLATQNSASEATQIQKVALYAIAAAVAIVVLPRMFK